MKRIPAIFITLLLALAAAGSQTAAKLPARIGYAELASLLSRSQPGILLLDVRTAEEFRSGHIKGAVLAPYDELPASFSEKDKGKPIVVYCRSGRRSAIAKTSLEKMGYSQVSDFGGIDSWKGSLVTGD
jgi:phage shock protein E